MMKTKELQGAALDWAVALIEGLAPLAYEAIQQGFYCPSTDWAQGGLIIEREKITVEWTGEDWMAYIWHDAEFFGPTPLIAATRAYVAGELGEEVEIPVELMEVQS
jgi:hypothetical protein